MTTRPLAYPNPTRPVQGLDDVTSTVVTNPEARAFNSLSDARDIVGPQCRPCPRNLASVLRVALDDLRACIAAGLNFDAGEWVRMDSRRVCSVCLAGASLMRHRPDMIADVDASNDRHLYSIGNAGLDEAPDGWGAHVFRALNALRSGQLATAAALFYEIVNPDIVDEALRRVREHRHELSVGNGNPFGPDDFRAFLADMERTAAFLERLGL